MNNITTIFIAYYVADTLWWTKKAQEKIPVTTPIDFFSEAISTLSTLVTALGAGLGVWGIVNLLEGYGSDNAASNGQGS